MAIIPNGEKVLMTSANVDTTYGGSAALKELNKWYTIEDIAETIGGGGGGGLGSIKIETDGQLNNPFSIAMSVVIPVDVVTPGVNTYEAISLPTISLSGQGGYGGSGVFTATTVSFPELTRAYGVSVQYATTLQTLSFPEVVDIPQSTYIQNCLALATVNFPKLVSANYLDFTNVPNLANVNFSSLVSAGTISSNGTPGTISAINATKFPALRSAGFNGSGIDSVDLPALTTLSNINFYSSALALLNFPGVVTATSGYIDMQYKGMSFNNFIIGTAGVTKQFGSIQQGQSGPYTQPQVNLANSYFNQATIDNWLIMLASLDGTNGTTIAQAGQFYSYGGGNAAPSQVGLNAKDVLLTRGWMVSTN